MTCKQCAGPVRKIAVPLFGYFGPGHGSLLYAYASLLSVDPRYSTPNPCVLMCDTCRIATLHYEPEPITPR